MVHQQLPTRLPCRSFTDLGRPCVHREFQLRSRNGKKNSGSAVHKQRLARGTWRRAWVEGAFRTLSLDGHFGRLWALVARVSLCNHGE